MGILLKVVSILCVLPTNYTVYGKRNFLWSHAGFGKSIHIYKLSFQCEFDEYLIATVNVFCFTIFTPNNTKSFATIYLLASFVPQLLFLCNYNYNFEISSFALNLKFICTQQYCFISVDQKITYKRDTWFSSM